MKYLPFFLLFTVFFSQAQIPVNRDSVTQLEEVILIDALKTKKVIGITPSDVISAKTFQNYSPVDMVSSINQIPGVYILSGALNTNRITIRGIGARTLFGTDKLRLYYNDIPVTNGTGSSTIESYDLENLGQIEVVKGPKGTEFGANLGGAIILTPKEALGRSTNLSNNFTVGSYGLIKNNLAINHYDGKLRLNLQYGHLETNGYRDNNNFERDGFLLNTSYQLSSKNKLSLLVNHIDYTAQIPSSLGITAFNEDPTQATFTWRASKGYETNNQTLMGVSLQHTFSENFKNATSIFYNYLDKIEARPFGILEEITNGFGFRSLFSGNLQLLNKKTNYSFGGELYKDEYDWDEFENLYQENNGNGSLKGNQFAKNKEFRSQWNLFSTLQYPFSSSFTAQLGLNLNKTDFNLQDRFNQGNLNNSGSRNFDPILLPSLSLNYKFNEYQELFGNISRGFTNPSLERTLTPEGVINPDIKQETGINYEVGTNLLLVHNRLKINVTLYQINVKNLLIREQVGDDQFIEKNAGASRHQGLELAMDYNLLSPTSNFQINPFINYNLNRHKFTDFVDDGNNYSGNDLTGVPNHRITMGLQNRFFGNYYLNLIYQHVGSIPLTDANDLYSDSFNLVNFRAGYRKKITPKFTFGVNFGVNNLFDILYARSVLINTQGFGGAEPRYYYPGNDRNFYGGFNLAYGL
ncbi:TonB-dependent receptor [Maribacter sp. PR1]|uniref:TonB-dependent receptor n=1 Tax=Maribacter cobaltidurans TaxID=1178778 RepID=A0ABU7ISJ0_9FLAO|nr:MULTISPECIES: TonB-dependent receptor [Maribacter]MDC6388108.1 TonB-dependent receptor [Maribacter sp. PR1]MEE1975496.1 TonB-dependent receptor [Maribacter cobaltidurans]